jgi:D-alanyl-D-alanine carboxypeptidase
MILAAALSGFLVSGLPAAKAGAQGVAVFPPQPESSGETELRALAAAYPDRISDVEQRDGDWALQVDGEWFSWAHGRLLPEARRADWEEYSRFRFYPYLPGDLPPLPVLDDAATARLKEALEDAQRRPPRRSEEFLELLYKAGSHAATVHQVTTVDFLGFQVQVHARIAVPLKAAAREIETAARADPRVAAFLRGLWKIDGFNYRDVAGTLSRSYHGYGLAVDLIPRSYGGKAAYWRWAMDANPAWWTIPYDRRWMMPSAVVAAFEHQGFVWGGKWLFFDTMHFEYRPELFR